MKFLKQLLLEFTSGREIEEKESKEQTAVFKLQATTFKKNLYAWEVQPNKD